MVGGVTRSAIKNAPNDESAIAVAAAAAAAAEGGLNISEGTADHGLEEENKEKTEVAAVMEKEEEAKSDATSSRIVAFVNAQSGGNAGKKLLGFLREQLGADQVEIGWGWG